MKVSHGRLATVAQENRENLARAVCVPTEVQTWPGQCVFPVCPQQYEPTPREYMFESLPHDPTYFVSSGI